MSIKYFLLILLPFVAAFEHSTLEYKTTQIADSLTFQDTKTLKEFTFNDRRYKNDSVSNDQTDIIVSGIVLRFCDDTVKSVKLELVSTKVEKDTFIKYLEGTQTNHTLNNQDSIELLGSSHVQSNTFEFNDRNILINKYQKLVLTFYIDREDLFTSTSYNLTFKEEIIHHITYKDSPRTLMKLFAFACIVTSIIVFATVSILNMWSDPSTREPMIMTGIPFVFGVILQVASYYVN